MKTETKPQFSMELQIVKRKGQISEGTPRDNEKPADPNGGK
jgi:hypothetical protein